MKIHRLSGITLIELMIVLVVIAVLAAIALPSYRQHVLRTYRTEAKSALLELRAKQERWYLSHHAYTTDPEALGFPGGRTENDLYTISIVPDPAGLARGYIATAVAAAGGGFSGADMSQDTECAEFSISAQGVTAAAPDPRGRCW